MVNPRTYYVSAAGDGSRSARQGGKRHTVRKQARNAQGQSVCHVTRRIDHVIGSDAKRAIGKQALIESEFALTWQ